MMLCSKVGVVGPLAIILLCYLSFCECFTSKFQTPSSFVRQSLHSRRSVKFVGCDAKKKSSEFSVVDDEEEEDDDPEVDFRQRRRVGGDLLVINEDAKSRRLSEVDDSTGKASSGGGRSSSPEYAALRPGTVVQVQVGDLSLARKAWKKRRRTGSPLLVPCSILNVDRRSAVRWNLIFLLEKFGQPGKGKRGGIVMSLKDIARYYRSFLKSSLGRQSEALGFDSNQEMVEELFNKKSQESYGVFFEKKEEDKKYLDEDGNLGISTVSMLYLTAPINRRKAQQRASNPAMLQFRPPREGDYDDIGVVDTSIGAGLDEGVHVDGIGTLTHTGWIRAVKEEKYISEDGERKLQREYANFPLSACIRVSQKDDLDTGRVQEGKILPAVVFDFDKIGDGGSPLLTLSLNAASGGKQRLKIKPDKRYNILKKGAKYQLSDLKVGDGPYRAKVIKLIGRKQTALVDLGVGRELSSAGGNVVQVLGILRYQDAVELEDSEGNSSPFTDFDDEEMEDIIASSIDELDMLDDEDDNDNLAEELLSLRKGSFEPGTFEDGEVEEDISGLYEVDENGQLVFKDPETGGRQLVEDIEEDEEDNSDGENVTDDDDISDEDMASLFSQNEDGSITYKDPETGETLTVNESDDEFKDMMMVKSLIDDDLSGEGKSASNPKVQESKEKPKLRSKRLQVGEYIEVYISNVSKQSNKFQVTTNPLVKGQKAKDIKKEAGAKKKLDRLKKSFGGDLDRIYALKGRECEGIVKATSKTGDWVYVQPSLEDLPVGIALLESDDISSLSAGDNVLVRLSGIDEDRGQLSMNVISKV